VRASLGTGTLSLVTWLLVLGPLVLAALYVLVRQLARFRPVQPPTDVPGVRSALSFERPSAEMGDEGDAIPDAALLDGISEALERVGAEAGAWRWEKEECVELEGILGVDPFFVTLGGVGGPRFLLHVYSRTLGGPRYVAPPRSESMRVVLQAIDRAVRSAPGVRDVRWQRREDSYRGEKTYYDRPVDDA
jgi:hypothetical protein